MLKPRGHFLSIALGVLCVLSGFSVDAAPPAEPSGIRYQVVWEGLDHHPQREALKKASRIEQLKDIPPPSLPLLRKRMLDDLPRLRGLLQADGYYLSGLDAKLDNTTVPPTVRFDCEPGALFTIGKQQISYQGHPPQSPWTSTLKGSDPATTQVIENAETRMIRYFKNNGYPYPVLLSKDYELDPERRKMDLTYTVGPGPAMKMGHITIEGLVAVDEKAILRQVNWRKGDRYDLRLVEDLEKDLILTGLFSRVQLIPVEPPAGADHINFIMSVTERHFRTLRLGVNYRSDVGFGAKSSWEHRNLFGHGEHFKTDLTLAQQESIVSTGIRKPGFQINNQSLILGVTVSEKRPDAYTSLSFESYAGLERAYNRTFSSSLGLAYKYSTVKQGGHEENFGLLSLPLQSVWNSTRNDLDPVAGHRLEAQATPYTDILNHDLNFGKLQLTGSRYLTLLKRPQLVLAGRVALGSLLGAAIGDIPADERFYAGGGGSVRGYSYQAIGPRIDGQSVGGSSLLETSLELRARLTETWGLATFVDGGVVTNETSPFGNQPMQWGAGVGLRIFTGIGPLRIDFAYPVNPDEDQKSRLQFYISLGQSF